VELPEPARLALHRDQETGLLVVGVERHSPAEAGGLMTGDILVGVGGQPVPDHDALFAHLGSESVDHSVPIEVVRGGQPAKMEVTIGARP
jgi:S1-C subfamily serine protease